jgi:thioredoxin reductase
MLFTHSSSFASICWLVGDPQERISRQAATVAGVGWMAAIQTERPLEAEEH